MNTDQIAQALALVIVAPFVVVGCFVALVGWREKREQSAHAQRIADRRSVPDVLLDRQWGEW